MKIQIITNRKMTSLDDDITVSTFSRPMAIDDYDVDVVDLSCPDIWENKHSEEGPLNIEKDLSSISKMIDGSISAKILYVYPQNSTYHYMHSYISKKYEKQMKLKDLFDLKGICQGYLACFASDSIPMQIVFEPTNTTVGDVVFRADFHFVSEIGTILTKSDISGKITTINDRDKYYFTTLDVCDSLVKLKRYINSIFINENNQIIPEWINEFDFYTDREEKTKISQCNETISELQNTIRLSENVLEQNNRYKSILFESGDVLVNVVFDILQQMLDCDLSRFVDKKKEDFRIEKESDVFIGEIKGINTNLKNENVSQLEVHVQSFYDEMENQEFNGNVYSILIINTFRSRELGLREPIHEQQIQLAKKYNSLIIETITLLKLFEAFKMNKISTNIILELLKTHTGILNTEDIETIMSD